MDETRYPLIESPLLDDSAAAEQYWTPARIEAIQPIPLRKITLQPGLEDRSNPNTATRAPTLIALPIPPESAGLAASGVSNADTARVADMTALPFCFVGKLRMSFPGGDYQGSAWVIGKRAILTAGHCVYDRGFARNIQFLPQMRGNQAPATFSIVKMTTLKEFVERDDLRFDIGACILDRPIAELTGMCGYVVNPNPLTGKLAGIGYPARPQDGFPFDGVQMWRSVGDVASDSGRGTTQDRNYGMYNDMSGGCSGGPWFTTGSPQLAIGLNSHIYTDSAGNPVDVPRQMRSPYFGGAFLRLLQWIKENGGEPNEPGGTGGGGTIPPPVVHDHAALKVKLESAIAALKEVAAGL